jgi:hypothetical protein
MEMRVGPGAKAVTLEEARTLLRLVGFAGDDYDLTLHAAAIKRAYADAYAP